ncbi:DUF6950 family protein [Paracoccus aminophilus]|uniref:DUF6950 domain-containing protein n=1 Tax=Paracoccus aminophilus JCM 7686 TaxID=1367847 RepID=S5Y470_PARAH|nr:hypothetical protein [Paracoccus aminophilus]AGT09312.1 hypothetical protein JCM7686_2913 [Paracoccus aminophilus JCM 7686]AGT10520.1 hypothetical protein JCM7686_2234 [Paracoccus aminophilus JCM 7686]
MAARVGDYIRQSWHRPWSWGEVDCTIWVADWCRLHWDLDPAARWRGRYATEVEMRRITGGNLPGFLARECPLPQRAAAREGDVAVIAVAGHEVAAIRHGEKWAFRKPHGVGLVRAEAIQIWGR